MRCACHHADRISIIRFPLKSRFRGDCVSHSSTAPSLDQTWPLEGRLTHSAHRPRFTRPRAGGPTSRKGAMAQQDHVCRAEAAALLRNTDALVRDTVNSLAHRDPTGRIWATLLIEAVSAEWPEIAPRSASRKARRLCRNPSTTSQLRQEANAGSRRVSGAKTRGQ